MTHPSYEAIPSLETTDSESTASEPRDVGSAADDIPPCDPPQKPSRRRALLCKSVGALAAIGAGVGGYLCAHHELDRVYWMPHPRTTCGDAPHHLHLAPGCDAGTSVTVSFATRTVDDAEAAVYVSASPDMSDAARIVSSEEALSYRSAYPPSAHKPKDAVYQSTFQHHVAVNDLKPDTTYYYRVAMEAPSKPAMITRFGHRRRRLTRNPYTRPYSEARRHPCMDPDAIRSFKTLPAEDAPVSIAMFGDLGQFGHSRDVLRSIRDDPDVRAAVLVGDVAYTDYDHGEWDTFFDMLDDLGTFHGVTLAIAAGNHDIDKQANTADMFQAYENRFRMPRVRPPQLDKFDGPKGYINLDNPAYPLPYEYGNSYYSFVAGPTLQIILNSYASVDAGSKQYEWLVETLSKTDRSVTPWIVVSIHAPFYNTYDHHQRDNQVLAAREHLEPVFVAHRVNLVVSGHVHAYQRTHNVIDEKLDPAGPAYVTVGAGGRAAQADYAAETPEPWLAARDASMFGYGKFTAFNATAAAWEWVPVTQGTQAERFKSYNTVSGHPFLHLPALRSDEVQMTNQYYLSE